MRFLCEGLEGTGTLRDVSRAGLFVCAEEIPRTGAAVALQFHSAEGSLIDLRGEVRWTTRGLADPDVTAGFGVVVHEPPTAYREFVAWALSQEKPPADEEPFDP